MYNDYTPTYLYVKRHSITGLQYFGKTIKNPFKYLGSGKYWLNHINKHGTEYVETIWTRLFINKEQLVEFAINFSKLNNIVENKNWANLILETGLTGGPRINNHLKIYNKQPRSKEWKQKLSIIRKGITQSYNCHKCIVNNKEFTSLAAAAKYFNVTDQTIYNWRKRGKVQMIKSK